MKRTLLFLACIIATGSIFAQKKTTTSGTVNFDATTGLDQLPKAQNKTVIVAIDATKGTIAFEVPVKNFTFGNPRIQEHFNGPNWLDSEKYPIATFIGTLTNLSAINFTKDGSYDADVEGDLTIHGVTRPVKTKGKITVNGKTVSATADFAVKLADYNIDGPQVSAGKISKEPRITVSANLQ
jgi:polyisoprenoid-binding protein YceI